MSARLYSRAIGQSSQAQVSRGFREALQAAGALAGEYAMDIEPLPEEPARPGAAAPHGIWTAPLAHLQTLRQAGRHARRWVMVAPNSTWMPPGLLSLLEATATGLLAPSGWAAEVLRELTPFPVTVVRHGVHPELTVAQPTTVKLLGMDYTLGRFRVGHFSTSERQRKGTRELIAAWELLQQRQALPSSAQLFLVLDAPAETQLILEFEGKFPPGVVLRSRLNLPAGSMAPMLQSLHLVCQPSRGEAFGLVPLESLACGTPVVATACTGHSEYLSPSTPGAVVVEHGPTGPIDDGDGAWGPTVSPDAIAAAVEIGYQRWTELKVAASQHAGSVQTAWAWPQVLGPFIEQMQKEEP
jgi:glycosyltransferase involved in cell wall biosynthesis